jgi:hypothetical protein
MSLAPGEQRALARIEDSLRTSDPQLAMMLATFSVLVTRRTRRCRCRACSPPWRLRLRGLVMTLLAAAVIGLLVLIATVRSPSG